MSALKPSSKRTPTAKRIVAPRVAHGIGPDDSRWIFLPVETKPPENSPPRGRRVAAAITKRQLDAVSMMLLALGKRPDADTWVVVMTRQSIGWPDDDNAIAALKHVRDAIANSYLRVDDGDEQRVRFVARRAKSRESGVLVEVLPIRWQHDASHDPETWAKCASVALADQWTGDINSAVVDITQPNAPCPCVQTDAPCPRDAKSTAIGIACALLSVGYNAGVRT